MNDTGSTQDDQNIDPWGAATGAFVALDVLGGGAPVIWLDGDDGRKCCIVRVG